MSLTAEPHLFWLNERENYKQTQRWLLRPQCQLNSQLTDAKINSCSVIRQNKTHQQEQKHEGTECAMMYACLLPAAL